MRKKRRNARRGDVGVLEEDGTRKTYWNALMWWTAGTTHPPPATPSLPSPPPRAPFFRRRLVTKPVPPTSDGKNEVRNIQHIQIIDSSIGSRIGSGNGSGIGSEIYFGIGSGISSGFGSGISFGIHSGIGSGIDFGISSGLGSRISSGFGSGIGFGIYFRISFGFGSDIDSGLNVGISFGIGSGIGSEVPPQNSIPAVRDCIADESSLPRYTHARTHGRARTHIHKCGWSRKAPALRWTDALGGVDVGCESSQQPHFSKAHPYLVQPSRVWVLALSLTCTNTSRLCAPEVMPRRREGEG